MTRSKLEAHRDEILQALAAREPKAALSRRLGVSRSTLRDFVARLEAEGVVPEPADEPEVDDAISREELLLAQLKQTQRQYRKRRKEDVTTELILEQIRAAVDVPAPKYVPKDLTPTTDGKTPHPRHAQALLLSDLHGGEHVDPNLIGGMNEYGWDILVEERMPRIHRSLLSYQANRPWPIEELQIWMLGDMCSGSNHEEIIETNELTAAEQAYQVGILLGKFVEELVPHYPAIKVYGVVGNHPRVTKAPQAKNTYNNFDWVAYKYCETYLSKYNVPCYFDEPSLTIAEIAGLNYLLFHGDGIRSSMPGVPWGGVTRRVNALKGQYADFGIHLDGYALGHFHDPNVVRDILMNGAVKGVDEWVLKQFGTAAPPTQLLATFNTDKSRLTDVSYINP